MCPTPKVTPTWPQQQVGADDERQERLSDRLRGLAPQDFHEKGIAICTAPGLSPPRAFRDTWYAMGSARSEQLANLVSCEALLMFCDLGDYRHVDHCMEFMQAVEALEMQLGINLPMRILVSHSVATTFQAHRSDLILWVTSLLLKVGANDAIVSTEPAGSQFVREVKCRMAVSARRGYQLSKAATTHEAALQRVEHVEKLREYTLFEYCRLRLRMAVPKVDLNIAPGELSELDGFRVGSLIGHDNSFACVYKLKRRGCNPTGQVLKMIPKQQIKSITGLLSLHNQIRVLESISSSSGSHPNIVKLHQVYHSTSHVCFRMEYGGDENLYMRLQRRDIHNCDLSLLKVTSIIAQAIAALSHMHSKLRVAHRDIKPENLVISEEDDVVNVKLIGFDAASIVKDVQKSSSAMLGTFPFMAPEMVLGTKVAVLPMDVWSLGVVFLELLCCSHFLEFTLGVSTKIFNDMEAQERKMNMEAIKNMFEAPDSLSRLLETEIRPELQENLSKSVLLLSGMLQVDVDGRWNAQELAEVMA